MTLSLPKEKIKIVLFEGIHKKAADYFAGRGYVNVETLDRALDRDELMDKISSAHIVGIRSRTKLSSEVLRSAKKLFAVGTFCIGTNQVDLEAAANLGLPVFNAPFSNTRSVAELVIAEIIMLARGLAAKNTQVHAGKWPKSAVNSFEVRGKNLGIIGYGHIGSQVGILAEAMGMRVLFFDIEKKLSLGNNQPAGSLDELLECSDFVTLHVPGTDLTKNMIGAREIGLMKEGSYLINASRGNVVAVPELAKALSNKKLLGAAVDVFPQEPAGMDDEFISELRNFENVILTPHIGGSTLEAQENIALEVADKLIKYSDLGTSAGAVNFPEVNLPPIAGKRRFLHIHKNLPGVMNMINEVFSSRKINVSAQYLQTNARVGYVVIDADMNGGSEDVVGELKKVSHTIRARQIY
jgi:D-3-phosphoglycerate dehydrogenase / 2-oxoglutarate reductase